MRRYKVTVTYEFEVEATNINALKQFSKGFKCSAPSCSLMHVPDSKSDYWIAKTDLDGSSIKPIFFKYEPIK